MKTLDAGSFVRPIQTKYVPQHVLEHKENRYFNEDNHVFCYTYYGIIAIPKTYLRAV